VGLRRWLVATAVFLGVWAWARAIAVPFNPRMAAGLIAGALLLRNAFRAAESDSPATPLWMMLGLAAILVPLTPLQTDYDALLRLAHEMRHGNASLAARIAWLEMFEHGGRFYFAYPPMTSFLLVPYAFLFRAAPQPPFNTLLILGAAWLLYGLLRGLEGARPMALRATIAYCIGTPIVYSAATGNTWLLMHSEGNFFFLLALYLGLVKKRFFWAGMALMTGAQCRYLIALAGLVFPLAMWLEAPRGTRLRTTAGGCVRMGLGIVPPLAAAFLFQWWTLGNPLLSPYSAGWKEWGWQGPDFSLNYFRRNFELYAYGAPALLPDFPYLRFDMAGQTIWVMSPFFLGIWAARLRFSWVKAMIPSAALMATAYLFYWGTGYAQYGVRYMQDLYPLLVPLAVSGFSRPGRVSRVAFRWLVGISIAINLYGAYVVLNFQK
jgi:hypothetical protein